MKSLGVRLAIGRQGESKLALFLTHASTSLVATFGATFHKIMFKLMFSEWFSLFSLH